MAKGTQVLPGAILKNFNTKIQVETKQHLDALVKVKGFAGHRELLEDMVVVYEKTYPAIAKQVQKYLGVIMDNPVAAAGYEQPALDLAEPQQAAAAEKEYPIPGEIPAFVRADSDLRIFTCPLEDGTLGMIAASGKARAAQMMGINYRNFCKWGGQEVAKDFPEQAKRLAMQYPEKTFVELAGGWGPVARTPNKYKG